MEDKLDSNLLVTYNSKLPGTARQELENNLAELKLAAEFLRSNTSGVFRLNVKDPRAAIKKLAKLCQKSPKNFKTTFSYTPIDMWCKTNIADMQSCIKTLLPDIKESDKWKLNLRKRHVDSTEAELIAQLTEPVDRALVNLNAPDKIIHVDIFNDMTGISLLKSDEFFNVCRIKH